MSMLRALLNDHRRAALALVVVALLLKALVPAGYMIGQPQSRTITVQVCADTQGEKVTRQIAIPMHEGHAPAGESSAHKDGAGTCAFSVLGFAALGGADPLLLAAAIAFIMVLGFAALIPARPRPVRFQRPPLRGPPSPA